MHKSTHSPRVWKYERAAAEPQTWSEMVNRTNFAAPNGCWEWTGTVSESGYGLYSFIRDGVARHVLAHRLALHMVGRPVPVDMTVDHLCRNHLCVNPEHLDIVTSAENSMRADGYFAVNARKTHCPQGHPYDAQNTGFSKTKTKVGVGRYCKACNHVRYLKKRAERTP